MNARTARYYVNALLAAALSGTAGCIHASAGTDRFTGVDQNRLAAALGWTLQVESLGRAGVVCKVGPPGNGVENFAIGVYPTEDLARETVTFLRQVRPVQPSDPPQDGSPGTEFVWWSHENRASVILRRDNLVITYSKSDSAALALARQIDELVRTDRQIAPRGVVSETPDITATGIPETLSTPRRRTRSATQPIEQPQPTRVHISPTFRGLGDPATLRLRIVDTNGYDTLSETTMEGRSQEHITVTDANGHRAQRLRRADEDGRFWFHVPLRAGSASLRMTVATPGNMIVTRTIAVTISESP